ncbi:MAG: hypothetical protein P4L33_04990 [Capsulimonadaceae bacterium]|nr:hypothetical protein [Capsulimonadaceae bacterium]
MKVRILLVLEDRTIDETVEAPTVDEVLTNLRDCVARQLGWKGVFLKALTPLQFAQEAVRKYNEAQVKNEPLPQTFDEFLKFGEKTGYLTVLEK